MPSSQLYLLLNSLSTSEWEKLTQWMHTPMHHSHEPSRQWFDFMHAHQLVHGSLPEAGVLPAIWRTRPPTPASLRKFRSLILNSVEAFIAFKEWSKDQLAVGEACLQAYRQRQLLHALQLKAHKLDTAHQKLGFYDTEHLQYDFQRSVLKLATHDSNERLQTAPYLEAEQQLLRWQCSVRLRHACRSLARMQTSGSAIPLPLLDTYLQLVEEQENLRLHPSISLYYHICCLYLPDRKSAIEIDHFEVLTRQLPKLLAGFRSNDQRDLLKLTINQIIRKGNQDPQPAVIRQAFNLYQLGIKFDLLLEDGYLSIYTFTNFMAICIRLEEFSTGRKFLNDYHQFLPLKRAKEVVALINARLLFAEGQPSEALLALQNTDYQDPIHLMNARMLQIRIYYETGEHLALADLIRSTRAILRRRRLGYHRENYRNNLRMVQRLLRLGPQQTKARDKLKKQITTTSPLTEREWLLRQLT